MFDTCLCGGGDAGVAMRRAAAICLLALGLSAQPARAEHEIVFTPVECPGGTICNTFHIIYTKANGDVLFERTFLSSWMASKVMIRVVTRKGTLEITSER